MKYIRQFCIILIVSLTGCLLASYLFLCQIVTQINQSFYLFQWKRFRVRYDSKNFLTLALQISKDFQKFQFNQQEGHFHQQKHDFLANISQQTICLLVLKISIKNELVLAENSNLFPKSNNISKIKKTENPHKYWVFGGLSGVAKRI